MSIEERLLKLERENRAWRTTFYAGAAIGGFWLAMTTIVAVVGLLPQKEEAPGIEKVVAGERLVADSGLIGTLRVERLEVGDVGTGVSPLDPLFVVDEVSGGEAMRVLMNNRDETSTIVIDTWNNIASIGLETADRQLELDARQVRLVDRQRTDGIPTLVWLGANEEGGGQFEAYNARGEKVTTVGTDAFHAGWFQVIGRNGRPTRFMTVAD